ncbi:MAG: transcription antitermination factor NusB [Clostridiales bacterium]|nr:transcription antitermination factor NusB [Clostridiales bacterium]
MKEKHIALDSLEDDFAGFASSGRRRARETALIMLYQMDFGGNDLSAAEHTLSSLGLNEDNAAFARQLVDKTQAAKTLCDQLIAEHSREWDFERLFNIDVTILRLALCELNSNIPYNIVINEAVELAKKFGDAASPAFVNAVLDAVNQRTEDSRQRTDN